MSVFKYHAFIFLDRPPPWRTEQYSTYMQYIYSMHNLLKVHLHKIFNSSFVHQNSSFVPLIASPDALHINSNLSRYPHSKLVLYIWRKHRKNYFSSYNEIKIQCLLILDPVAYKDTLFKLVSFKSYSKLLNTNISLIYLGALSAT
jgi:hypothetical protein